MNVIGDICYPVKHKSDNTPDKRYAVKRIADGHTKAGYHLHFCNSFIYAYRTLEGAKNGANAMRDNGHTFLAVGNLTLSRFVELYLDYVNNFLTVERFAEHYAITLEDAKFIVETGHAISSRELTKVIY